MRIQLLGPVAAFAESGDSLPVGGPKQRTVLAILALTPGVAVPVDAIIDAVWGESVPPKAHRSLATYVSNLRATLGVPISRDADTYTLDIGRSAVDAARLEDAAGGVEIGARLDPVAVEELRAVLAQWRGTPFGGVDSHGAFAIHTTRLVELRLIALEALLGSDIDAGQGDAALIELDSLVEAYPHRERLRALQMTALYRSGRQADALEVYRAFRERLAEDLGIDPSQELQDLELSILQQTVKGPRSRRPGAARGVEALPLRYASFIGREKEISTVRDTLASNRLVTVVGSGGIGKSSLAVESVRGLSERTNIARVVVEPLETGEVARTLAENMGLQPAAGVDAARVIVRYAGDADWIFVLDGCEAHAAEVAKLADGLLTVLPRARVLATSREPIGLPGERLVRIGGLPIDDAVALFCDRADLDLSSVDGLQNKIEDVCLALDGMALAIELAGSRARAIPVERLADRIDDQMPLLRGANTPTARHESMERAIRWSFDLLSEAEQRACIWLSAFRTGFSLSDAVGVLHGTSAEETVARLVDVSMLQPADEDGLHRFLEPIRQFIALVASDEGEIEKARRSHAHWMVAEARRVAPLDWTASRGEVREWIFRRRHEFIAAIEWAASGAEPNVALAVFAEIGRTLRAFAELDDLLETMATAFDNPRAIQDADMAIALANAVSVLNNYERRSEAQQLIERAALVLTEIDDQRAHGEVLLQTVLADAGTRIDPGDPERAERAIELLAAGGLPHAEVHAVTVGVLLNGLGRWEEALAAYERADRCAREMTGLPHPWSMCFEAEDAWRRGDVEVAARLCRDAAAIEVAQFDFTGAHGSWYQLGHLGSASMDDDMLRLALDESRTIEMQTGARSFLFMDLYEAHMERRSQDVLRLVVRWFNTKVAWGAVDDVYISDDVNLTIFGESETPPRIFWVLHPAVVALFAEGYIEEACGIAFQVPALMEQAPFEHWERFRGVERWEDLRQRCDVAADPPMDLQQLFDRVQELVFDWAGERPSVDALRPQV